MGTLVTVAVATYNSAAFVEETLESIFNQSYSPIALVVSDDCSKDNTVQIVQNWLAQDRVVERFDSIQLVTVPENTGVSANCNRSIAAAPSDYVKFIAGDDIILPDGIQKYMAFAIQNPQARIIFSQIRVYQDHFKPESYVKTTPLDYPYNLMDDKLTAHDQYQLLLLSDRIHYTPSFFLNKHAIIEVGGYDEENKLVGVVTVDDVLDVIREEATEDIYALAGVSSDDNALSAPIRSVRLRLPWLLINLATAILASTVVHIFEGTIGQVTVLASLMPIVAGMGGNAGTQTLAVIVRGLALGEVTWDNSRRVILKEAAVALANGLATGVVAAFVVWLWYGRDSKMALIGGIIALAMINNMLIAGIAGTAIPLILKKLKADPALASTVFVTTCTDIGGFLSFLGLATLLLKYLV